MVSEARELRDLISVGPAMVPVIFICSECTVWPTWHAAARNACTRNWNASHRSTWTFASWIHFQWPFAGAQPRLPAEQCQWWWWSARRKKG